MLRSKLEKQIQFLKKTLKTKQTVIKNKIDINTN
jgi:hypothetical protein